MNLNPDVTRYHIQELRRPSQDPVSYMEELGTLTRDEFTRWALAACGGGFTTRQTTDAMALCALVDSHGEAHLRDFLIRRV